MKKLILTISLLVVLFFVVQTIFRAYNKEKVGDSFRVEENNSYTYRVGEGRLYQFKDKPFYADYEQTDTLWTEPVLYRTMEIPFINEINHEDLFRIIKKNAHSQYSYLYKEEISREKLSSWKKRIWYLEKQGRMEWNTVKEEPIIKIFEGKKVYEDKTRWGHIIFLSLLGVGIFVLLLCFLLVFLPNRKQFMF